MKIKELKENEPIEIINVSNHMVCPLFFMKKEQKIVEREKIHMAIFADGKVSKETGENVRHIEEYYIHDKKYDNDVDTLKTKRIYLNGFSYAIVYLIAEEWEKAKKISGYLDIVQDVTVYLSDMKDTQLLKKVSELVTFIADYNEKMANSSLFNLCCNANSPLNIEEISGNVYTIKR